MIKDKVIEGILKDVANKNDISLDEVEKVLNSPYKFMRDTITKLDLKGKKSNEIEGLKTNFTMPALFKLYVNKKKVDFYIDNVLNKKEENE